MDLLSQKMAVLTSPRNKLIWGKYKLDDYFTKQRLGVTYTTAYRWKRGETYPKLETLRDVILPKLLSLDDVIWPARLPEVSDFTKSTGIHEFSVLFGIERRTCNQILDETLFAQRPLFPAFYFGGNEAEEVMETFGGIYHLYHRGLAAEDFNKMEVAAIQVRYPIETRSAGEYAIRVKLTKNTPAGLLEYDGFLGQLDTNLYWMFEQRKGSERDGIVMLTDRGTERIQRRDIRGQYVSVIHDRINIPSGRPLIMGRVEMSVNPTRKRTRFLMENVVMKPAKIPTWVRKSPGFGDN